MNAPDSRRVNAPEPYSARALSLAELRAGDIHTYWSPKLGRLVRVNGLVRIAQTVLLEFAPEVETFVERPRVLQVGDRLCELDFWVRDVSGRERMLLLVGDSKDAAGRRRGAADRFAQQLLETAAAAHLPLDLITERSVLARKEEIALAYRLLPSVQAAAETPDVEGIAERLLALLADQEALTIAAAHVELTPLPTCDIDCVIAHLLHQGRIRSDATARLKRSTLLRRPT